MKKIHLTLGIIFSGILSNGCSSGKKPDRHPLGAAVSKDDETESDSDDAEESQSKSTKKLEKNLPKSSLDTPPELAINEEMPEPTIKSCSALDTARTYKGFGGVDLKAGRVEKVAPLGDRYRIKPFDALGADITRVFNNTAPASLANSAATFPTSGNRWFVEPIASGITLFTTYRIAFDGGLTLSATNPDMASAPTPTSAEKICSDMMTLAWRRSGTPEEIKHCQNIAVMATASETDNKVRWAHAIASILTAVDFISY